MKRPALASTVVILAVLLGQATSHAAPQSNVEGTWLGTMRIPSGPELRLVLDIEIRSDGTLAVDLTSVDQGGSLPMDEATLKDNHLSLKIRTPEIVVEGELVEDGSTFDAEFAQGGGKFPVRFELVDEVPGFARPQRPKKPYPYGQEEVSYENKTAGIRIAGTLTKPRSQGSFPAVLLIAGSGPHSRNEVIGYHRTLHVLADHLTRQGFAVLRVDKRGVGGSTGDYWKANTEDLASDVLAGVEYLKTRADINKGHIGLIGHSEGGSIAAMVAARTSDVGFIVMMAGPGIPAAEILYYQDGAEVKAEGASDEKVAVTRRWWQQMYGVVNQERDNEIATKKIKELFADLSEPDKQLLGWSEGKLNYEAGRVTKAAYRYFLKFDPTPFLTKAKCPMLAMGGTKDCQVPSAKNLRGVQEILQSAGNYNCEIKELPGLNHMFQTAVTGAVSEYGKIEETIAPTALKTITEWMFSQTGR
ncbi:MAG TPA: alpha/beta hydrolase [Phycisphaerales bacterium]|nr:alpha/beta hydrolase [Phycisphaerales bacterium]